MKTIILFQGFNIHERYPNVVHLAVHLENGHRVYYTKDNMLQKATQGMKTTLTGFFELCKIDKFAKTLLYNQVPKYYTWNIPKQQFLRRKMGAPVQNYPGLKSTGALGRVYTVHPNNAECYYLRMLLHNVKGPTSFEYLRTV